MNARPVETGAAETAAKLPARDWILLPALSLLTIIAVVALAELSARWLYSESPTDKDSCLVLNDSSTGVRGIPNSVCWMKNQEDQAKIEYRFDAWGYRNAAFCGPKAPETYRIVMTGSSMAMGERVPLEKTFASLLPKELSARTGRSVELYNEAMAYGFARNTALRFSDVLAAKPDLILWAITPMDVSWSDFAYSEKGNPFKQRPNGSSTKDLIVDQLRERLGTVLTGFALKHLLYTYLSQDFFIASYLRRPDEDAGFLRADFSATWKSYLKEFDRYATDMEERSASAGVPFVALVLPNRGQAAMLARGSWPAGFDPYKFNNEVRSVITSHGGTFIDTFDDLRKVPNLERYYYAIDNHPTLEGQALLNTILAGELTNGSVPALTAHTGLASERRR